MPSSATWRRVDLLRTDISEERVASIFRVEKNTQNKRLTLFSLAYFYPSEMSVLASSIQRNIPEAGSLHSHRRGNLKSYNIYKV
jgi:hypothetical protein